jgi:hypothetical protein
MEAEQFRDAVRGIPEPERAKLVAEAAADLSKKEREVVARAIDVWPQESVHRMWTILGSVLLALGAGALAVWATTIDAESVGTALVALSTAIVGGIFGYAQGGK